ncbi:ABC transporter permease [Caulobacter sp. FWC2]|uniref:MlaE family ABC transporter permease n=1 Tax=Caulobacter sp. FWC2 TaxID=69664 RepID=UPI000C152BC2|nr:ABC transporter permease [Caulobacter sp. FWC2]PIB91353.1 ABC transporter permease [Caulobacter sp. FWC2]
MALPADFTLNDQDGRTTAVLTGDWTARGLFDAGLRLDADLSGKRALDMDLTGINRCDTAGAYAILRAGGENLEPGNVQARREVLRLLELVRAAIQVEPEPEIRPGGFHALLERIGRGVFGLFQDAYGTLVFLGHLLVAVARCVADPRRIRWAPVVALCERAGLDALPIVATTTFFIGAVVALLGANMLTEFGAQVYSVELIGISVMREFNILITAILLAGRSASSFAAEIGSMKMNQEIDAMQVMGVDPYEALVLPRFAALLFTIPLLVFVATIAGLAGGMLVVWVVLDLSPTFFLQRIIDFVGATHFWIGMSKAPVMAAVIAAIGCRQGMEVGNDVESLGRRVTASVVHAIFAIILIDAVFALVYMELDI